MLLGVAVLEAAQESGAQGAFFFFGGGGVGLKLSEYWFAVYRVSGLGLKFRVLDLGAW